MHGGISFIPNTLKTVLRGFYKRKDQSKSNFKRRLGIARLHHRFPEKDPPQWTAVIPAFRFPAFPLVCREKGRLPLATVLRCRIRYFTDGMVLGSASFVQEQLEQDGCGKQGKGAQKILDPG